MSAPQPPEAAKKAAHDTYCCEPDCDHQYDEVLGNILTAALPHLHRAWLEGLISKLDAEAKEAARGYDYYNGNRKLAAAEILRVELAEEGSNDE